MAKLAPGPGNVALAKRPEPVARPGHVVLEVAAAGICGTDLHIVDDEFPSRPPVTLGHEVSGVVASLGDGVDGGWLGARVVTETYFSTCETCASCRAGRRNLCPERRSIGSAVDGGFAARVEVPAGNLHRIPDWLDGTAAAMAEPLACCCQSLPDGIVGEGDEVLVVGPGPVGLLAAQVAGAAGARVHVRGVPRDVGRLALAAGFGYETSTTEDAPSGEFDVVVECSGHKSGIGFALDSARRGARYVQIGIAGKPVSIPFDLVCFKELTITSGNASTSASWRRALALVESRAVALEPLLSAAVPLEKWEEAFADSRAGLGVKYVLVP
ncbi:MAG TPA: alcohol dehydrogenase catalytic domain-containing protein [Gaiella sp.]|nr:alcohol dehydrogenase catalytic domain-containing protein [Gaiella sp.]